MANSINFSNTTPAAPAGKTNVTFQNDSSTTPNVSAYVPTALLPANNLSDVSSASTALTNLGGNNASNLTTGTVSASLIPTLNQSTTGNASTATTATNLAGGSAGSIPYQSSAGTSALLAGNTAASDQVLVSHGTGSAAQAPTLSNAPALSAANMTFFPTFNQSTTGTAANVTGTVSIANGGTGSTTAAAAYNALSPMTTLGDLEYESGANTAARLAGNTSTTKQFLTQTGTGTVSAAPAWGAIGAADVPTLNQSTTGNAATATTAGNVTGTVAIANGGTGATSAAAALTALGGASLSAANNFSAGQTTTLASAANGTFSSAPYTVALGIDGTLGPLKYNMGGMPSATGSSRYWVIGAFDNAAMRALVLNGNGYGGFGNVLVGTVTDNTTDKLQVAGTVNISGNVTLGTALTVANGGTGSTSAAAAFNALSPVTTLGDLVYGSAANTSSRLAGNTTTTKQFLTQTGTGSASASPAWGSLAVTDLPSTVALTNQSTTWSQTFTVSGFGARLAGLATGVRNVTATTDTANYATDHTLILNGVTTENLPASPPSTAGVEFYFVNVSASAVTISGNGNSIWSAGTTATTISLASNATAILQWDYASSTRIWRQIK